MIKIKTQSTEETETAGFCLGRIIAAGDTVSLDGGLGSGKTSFTRGIARALGFEGHVTSPTFTIVNEYNGLIPLYHFDVYRLNSSDELLNTGFEDYLDESGIIVVEWADLVKDDLPADRIAIKIMYGVPAPSDVRYIRIDFIGSRYMYYNDKMLGSLSGLGIIPEK